MALLLEEEPENVEAHKDILLAKGDDRRRRFGTMRGRRGSGTEAIASKLRRQMQDGIDAIAATNDYAWLKKSAIGTVMKFVDRGCIEV